VLRDPFGLPGIWGQKGKSDEPSLAGLPRIAGFERLGFSRKAIQLLGMNQRVTVIAR
jgi:hypothetical protein